MNRSLVGLSCAAWLIGVSFSGFAAGQDDAAEAQGGGRGVIGDGRGGARGGAPAQGAGRSTTVTTLASFNQTQVARGKELFAGQCASCHGVDARGGSGKTDVDLLRQPIVMMDITGKPLADFLRAGHPPKGTPKFDFTAEQVTDVSAWLRYEIADFVAGRGGPRHNVFSGNAKAGEAFFNGSVGTCSTCHSVGGNLKGIGARTNDDAPTLIGAILSGSAGTGGTRGRGAAPGSTVTATVTLQDRQQFVGAPLTINDWLVEIRLADGTVKRWLPKDGWPNVTRTNRLQAHVDLMLVYTDDDLHNLAAYLRDK